MSLLTNRWARPLHNLSVIVDLKWFLINLRFLNERSAVAVVMRVVANKLNIIKMTNVGYVPKSWRCQYDFQRNCSVSKAMTVTRIRSGRKELYGCGSSSISINDARLQNVDSRRERLTIAESPWKHSCSWAMQMKEHCTLIVLVCIGCRNICANCAVLWPTTLGSAILSPFISVACANKRTISFFTHCN